MTDTPTPEAPAGLLTSRQAAGWLGISERSLMRMKAEGSVPFVKLAGRTVRYRLASLEVWAESQEQRETPRGD